MPFATFTENVSRRVPPDLLACVEEQLIWSVSVFHRSSRGFYRPSGCSKSRSSREDDFSKGRSRSHSFPSTWWETVASADEKWFESALARSTDLGDDSLLCETLADAESDRHGGGFPARALFRGAVGEGDRDGFTGHACGATLEGSEQRARNASRAREGHKSSLATLSSYSFFKRSNISMRESMYSGLGSNSRAAMPAARSPFLPFFSFFSFFGAAGAAAASTAAASGETCAAGSAGVAVECTGWGAVDMVEQSRVKAIRDEGAKNADGRK